MRLSLRGGDGWYDVAVSVGLAPPFLSPQLRLEVELGRGAMGEVWRAHSLSLDAAVAVKVLFAVDNEVARARFQHEAQGAARIASPHVVRIFDFGISPEGLPFIVMELLVGRDLRARLNDDGPMRREHAQAVVEQACRAVDAAHQLGVIHRDIKPANLFLIEGAGEIFVKLVDFGVAKHRDRDLGMTETGALMGTPYYMSPEQLLNPKAVDHRCDLWSLAVVAYACLAGTVPFVAETLGGLSIAIHERRFTPLSTVRPDLPASVDRWFETAFHTAIEQRFQTAGALAQTLGGALAGTWPPQSARPPVSTQVMHAVEPALALHADQRPGSAPPGTVAEVLTSPPLVAGPPGGSGPPVTVAEVPMIQPPVAGPSPVNVSAAPWATPAATMSAAPPRKSRRGLVLAVSAVLAFGGFTAVGLFVAQRLNAEATPSKGAKKSKSASTARASADDSLRKHPRYVGAAALEDRDDDPDPTKVFPVKDHRRYDVNAHVRAALDWAQRQDPKAALVTFGADDLRADGTVDLEPPPEETPGGVFTEVFSPQHQRCWHITPLTNMGVYANLAQCNHELTGELPRCSVKDVLARAFPARFPKGVSLTYRVDVVGRREWLAMNDDTADRQTLADSCGGN